MNVKHVIGLAAIVLGGMTSCSNILEEEGVANTITKGETGELRINLVADGSLNVTTKSSLSLEGNAIELTDEEKKGFVISGTLKDKTVALGIFANYYDGKTKTVSAGTYTNVTATYTPMNGNSLAFDAPEFSGTAEGDVVVTANNSTGPISINTNLTNSIISIDKYHFNQLIESATINNIFVYEGDVEPEDSDFKLLSAENTLETEKILYVKPNKQKIHIIIKGILKNDGNKGFKAKADIMTLGKINATEPAKNYNVQYKLSDNNGSLGLTVSINGEVVPVNIYVEFDPYNPTPSQE